MANGRCRMHGGPSPGAPKGNSNALKHGRYSAKAVADRREINLLQATQAACMPTLDAAAQGDVTCRLFATQMDAFFRDRKVDLVIISADWLEYGRG